MRGKLGIFICGLVFLATAGVGFAEDFSAADADAGAGAEAAAAAAAAGPTFELSCGGTMNDVTTTPPIPGAPVSHGPFPITAANAQAAQTAATTQCQAMANLMTQAQTNADNAAKPICEQMKAAKKAQTTVKCKDLTEQCVCRWCGEHLPCPEAPTVTDVACTTTPGANSPTVQAGCAPTGVARQFQCSCAFLGTAVATGSTTYTCGPCGSHEEEKDKKKTAGTE